MRLETYFTALGSMDEQKRLDIIANNIANSNSPGFKRDDLHFSDVLGEVSYTSMSQGPMRETGNDLDLALYGDGFLSVQTDQGILYTRAGNLTMNSSKQLTTQDGWPVLGKNGTPVTFTQATKIRITETGQVFDGNDQVGDLNIVQFPANSLSKAQNGYFQPQEGVQPQNAVNCVVRQRVLEGANFNPVEEMAKMVQTMRNFESYQKTLQNGKNLDSELISKTAG